MEFLWFVYRSEAVTVARPISSRFVPPSQHFWFASHFFFSVLSVLLVVVVPFGVFHSKFSPRFFCLTSAEVWRRKSFSWSRQCTYVAVWDIYMIHTRRNETTAAAATTKRERGEKTTTRKLSNSHSSAVALLAFKKGLDRLGVLFFFFSSTGQRRMTTKEEEEENVVFFERWALPTICCLSCTAMLP